MRFAFVAGGAIFILMVFIVVKSLSSSGTSNMASLTTVIQYQQALIHISTVAGQQPATNTVTQNSAATIQTSVTSAQQQLATYLKTSGQSVSKSIANKKLSSSTDAQLSAAASTGTYDKTYLMLTRTLLTDYEQALKQAYSQTAGPKGQALLNSEYNSAQLLVQQLTP